MITLADTLHRLQIRLEADEKIRAQVFAQTRVCQHENVWLAEVARMVGKTPETEEQLVALMQLLGKEIWQHHVRQMQREHEMSNDSGAVPETVTEES